MIWDNLSISRATCAIACGTRAYCCEDFFGCREGEMTSEIPEIVYAFGPQLYAFMSVGILLKYFPRKLLHFEWSKTVPNLGMSRFITDQVVFRCFFYKNFTLLHSKSYICKKINSFSMTQLKASWIYLDIAAFQNFKVFLLLPHACEDFGRVFATEK